MAAVLRGTFRKIVVVAILFILSFSWLYCHEQNANLNERAYTDNIDNVSKDIRYLLYDVNPGEGFNLRRDVYMRIANLVVSLNAESPWILVLPAWTNLYHWQTPNLKQARLPWSAFFDMESLNKHVPVMEFEDFLKVTRNRAIDEVYYLQRYVEGWTDGKFEEKMHERPCIDRHQYYKVDEGSASMWGGYFFGFKDVTAHHFRCLSLQGHAGILKPFLLKNTTARSILIDRAETVLHDMYGDRIYWQARRSMRYAKHLRDIADEFRSAALNSTDELDGTILTPWWKMERHHGDARGGPYLCAHLRRRDYLRSHKKDVPSLRSAASQITSAALKYNLTTVFISSDMPSQEFTELRSYMPNLSVLRYTPTQDVLRAYKDGGVSIIDQWICAHARYFTGSHVSTFSFRIHEDREILGFQPEMTFNSLCGDDKVECEQPAKWMVTYTDNMYW